MKDAVIPKDFGGVPGFVMDILIRDGYDTVTKLRNATDEQLGAVEFMGPGRVKLIRKALKVIDEYDREGEEYTVGEIGGGYIWLDIWRWRVGNPGRGGKKYSNFAKGVEVRSVRFNHATQYLSLLIWSRGIKDDGKPELSFNEAVEEYPFLFKKGA